MSDPEEKGGLVPDGVSPAAIPVTYVITSGDSGQRLDHFLASKYPEHSRSALNKLIGAAQILMDGRQVKAGYRLRENEIVDIVFPPPLPLDLVPEPVDFSVLYEDPYLLVINKPPGLVVHPGGGHRSGTLAHGLLHRFHSLPAASAERPGIVHRLDKDTSGVILVAKTENALRVLMSEFKDRKIRKTYHALLVHCPHENEGRIVAPVGRHPVDRKKMAIRPVQGKYAATIWRVLERFANGWCWAEIEIETGRTHQIRVHMASIKAPVAGDALYGGAVDRRGPFRPLRQMLHASTLRFAHPETGASLCITAPLAEDMQVLLKQLREAHS
jgi:23S rRNA pseudouridine1911/1915/1917 synthase